MGNSPSYIPGPAGPGGLFSHFFRRLQFVYFQSEVVRGRRFYKYQRTPLPFLSLLLPRYHPFALSVSAWLVLRRPGENDPPSLNTGFLQVWPCVVDRDCRRTAFVRAVHTLRPPPLIFSCTGFLASSVRASRRWCPNTTAAAAAAVCQAGRDLKAGIYNSNAVLGTVYTTGGEHVSRVALTRRKYCLLLQRWARFGSRGRHAPNFTSS